MWEKKCKKTGKIELFQTLKALAKNLKLSESYVSVYSDAISKSDKYDCIITCLVERNESNPKEMAVKVDNFKRMVERGKLLHLSETTKDEYIKCILYEIFKRRNIEEYKLSERKIRTEILYVCNKTPKDYNKIMRMRDERVKDIYERYKDKLIINDKLNINLLKELQEIYKARKCNAL